MFPDLNFAFVRLQSEKLYFNELERLNADYKNDPNYSNIHYLLIEIDKRCKATFGIKELLKLAQIYNYEPQQNNHRRVVWLVSQPIITALTHMFIGNIQDNSKYCSTIEKAYKLLELNINYTDFLKLLVGKLHYNY